MNAVTIDWHAAMAILKPIVQTSPEAVSLLGEYSQLGWVRAAPLIGNSVVLLLT